MSQNVKELNALVFSRLELFCEKRGDPVLSPKAVRFVAGDKDASDWLKHLRILNRIQFGRHKAMAHMEYDGVQYMGLLGFDFEPDVPNLRAIDGNPGMSVFMISQFDPSPIARPSEIRNIVEASHNGDPEYVGHDIRAVESLFPRIQFLECAAVLNEEDIWQLFLAISIDECRLGGSWIEDELAGDLSALAALSVPLLPYASLCRSIFDLDPRTLYMALYRCIEATYAYESCRKMVEALGLQSSWHQLAATLEREVGWHPREAASLNLILQYALSANLCDICLCLGEDPGADPQVAAGRAIYRLRNRIVHYRPGAEAQDDKDLDWNKLCVLLVSVVLDVFDRAYG